MNLKGKIFLVLMLSILNISILHSDNMDLVNNFFKFSKTKPDSILKYSKIILQSSEHRNDPELKAIINMFKGRYYEITGQFSIALTSLFDAKNYFENYEKKEYLPYIYLFIGDYYRHRYEIDSASIFYYKALNTEKSLQFVKDWVYNHLGDIHYYKNNLDSARYYFTSSLKSSLQNNDTTVIANNYNNLGMVAFKKQNYDSCVILCKVSLNLNLKINDIAEITDNFADISDAYLKKRDYKNALNYFYEALDYLSKSEHFFENRKTLEQGIEIFSELKQQDSIIKYLKILNNLEKNLNKNQEKMFRNVAEFESNMNNIEIQNRLLTEQDKSNKLSIYLLFSITILVLGSLIFVWKNFRTKKKENDELKIAYNQIQELNATKDKFFSIIAHDLKGPVSSMKNMIAMIVEDLESFSGDDLKDIMEEFKKQTDGTLGLLLNLLDWSRAQRGNVKYLHQTLDITNMIDENIYILEGIANAKQIKLINLNKEEVEVVADENTINTVIRNLISNSIKFSKLNSQIEIGSRTDIEKSMVTVFVRDFGVGMTPEQANSLFNASTNKSTYGTNNEKGTGLGLLICKDFVENNFGHIWVESKVGEGSTFYFTLLIPQKAEDI